MNLVLIAVLDEELQSDLPTRFYSAYDGLLNGRDQPGTSTPDESLTYTQCMPDLPAVPEGSPM